MPPTRFSAISAHCSPLTTLIHHLARSSAAASFRVAHHDEPAADVPEAAQGEAAFPRGYCAHGLAAQGRPRNMDPREAREGVQLHTVTRRRSRR